MGANASTAVPLYASGQVLDAARLNLTNAGIPVFSGTATRDAAFGGSGEKVLAEGQLCYLEDSNSVLYYDSAAWQAVSVDNEVLYVQATATTAIVSNTALTVLTGSGTIIPTRLYKVSGRVTVQPSSGTIARHALSITTTSSTKTLYYETNTVGTSLPVTYTGFACFTATELGVTTGSGTSVTFNLVYIDTANSGGLSTNPDGQIGANSSPQQLVVEMIGFE